MKSKFSEYEIQSEKYYADLLERFKEKARLAVDKKQKELNKLGQIRDEYIQRVKRLKERAQERKIKNFWSDESSEEEEDVPVPHINREVDLEEFNFVKAKRKNAKIVIQKFVTKFKEENDGKLPTDADTGSIAMELADFNHINEQYLDIKLALIKQDKMPFQSQDFAKE